MPFEETLDEQPTPEEQALRGRGGETDKEFHPPSGPKGDKSIREFVTHGLGLGGLKFVGQFAEGIIPIKLRDIDPGKDPMFGPFAIHVPPIISGLATLAWEYTTPSNIIKIYPLVKRQHELQSMQTRTPDQEYELKQIKELTKFSAHPKNIKRTMGVIYPTWQAMYDDLRDTIPGAGQLEAIIVMDGAEGIKAATQRWVEKNYEQPWDLITLGLGAARAGLLSRADKLRATAAIKGAKGATQLIKRAESIEKGAKWLERTNPEEWLPQALASTVKATSPPGYRLYNPELSGTYGIDKTTGKPLKTTTRPVEFSERIGMTPDELPSSVLTESEKVAAIEGWQRFDENEKVIQKFTNTKHQILEGRQRHAEDLAEAADVPAVHVNDPLASGTHGMEIYNHWQERINKRANDLSKEIASGVTDPHDAGKIAHIDYEKWQLGLKAKFRAEFDKIKTTQAQPVRLLDDAQIAEFVKEMGITGDINPKIVALLPETYAELQKQLKAESKLLSDPDLDKIRQILTEVFEQTPDELTLNDIDLLRTNFRKRVEGAVNNDEMTPIGGKQVASVFYKKFTEDYYNAIIAAVEASPDSFPDGFLATVKEAKDEYRRVVVELEDTPAVNFLYNSTMNPASFVDEILKEKGVYNPDQLQILKEVLGEDGWQNLQPALLDRFMSRVVDAETGNIDRVKLQNEIAKLTATHKNKLTDLFGQDNADKLNTIIQRTDLEGSTAVKFLQRTSNPENLVDELLKEKGTFNATEIAHLKEIFGEERWGELQPGLLGRIYQKANALETRPGGINPTALRLTLSTITKTNKKKLIDLFGKDTAEFLEQSALFAEQFGRADQFGRRSSPTAKLQKVAAAGGFTILLSEVGYTLWRTNMSSFGQLSAAEYIGAGLIVAAFGSAYAYKKFIASETGLKWYTEGWNIKIPGTNRVVRSAHLDAAAEWMIKNKFVLGATSRRIGQAELQAKDEEIQTLIKSGRYRKGLEGRPWIEMKE